MYIFLILCVCVVVSTISLGIVLEFKKEMGWGKRSKYLIKGSISSFIPGLAGFIIMLMPRIVYGADNTGSNTGLGFIAAALSTGLAAIATGIAVGSVGSSALGAVSEEPKMLGRSLIYVGLAEGIAIYGLIISVMILGRI